jgi:IS30 family transposase
MNSGRMPTLIAPKSLSLRNFWRTYQHSLKSLPPRVEGGHTTEEKLRLTVSARKEKAKELQAAGMSVRQIADTLGASKSTIHEDLAGANAPKSGANETKIGLVSDREIAAAVGASPATVHRDIAASNGAINASNEAVQQSGLVSDRERSAKRLRTSLERPNRQSKMICPTLGRAMSRKWTRRSAWLLARDS